jgi:hypothetical protein
MARWTMRRRGTERLLPSFRWEGRTGEVLVDALDRDDRFINGLDLRAEITGPDRVTRGVPFDQIAPGRYRGEFEIAGAGRYYLNLSGSAGDKRVGPETLGLAVPYSREYVERGVDRDLMRDLAVATEGRVLPLARASLAELTKADPGAVGRGPRTWWPLLALALVALLFEVAARKLTLPESWLVRWRRRWGRQDESNQVEPGYEELVAGIARVRAQHVAALRDGIHFRPDDPEVRARLYLAGSKKGRRLPDPPSAG